MKKLPSFCHFKKTITMVALYNIDKSMDNTVYLGVILHFFAGAGGSKSEAPDSEASEDVCLLQEGPASSSMMIYG